MSVTGFKDLQLPRGHGFLAQQSVQRPDVALLLPSVDIISPDESKLAPKDKYHDVLRQMADAGVRRVVVDAGYLNLTPSQKLAFAYMKPSAEEVPDIEKIYIAGITRDEIWQGAHSEHAARSMETSPGLKTSIDEAIAECLR